MNEINNDSDLASKNKNKYKNNKNNGNYKVIKDDKFIKNENKSISSSGKIRLSWRTNYFPSE